MRKAGIEIGDWELKSHREFFEKEVHTVVTVCGNAKIVARFFWGR